MLKYQSFFYTFDELGEAPSASAIRRACPEKCRRQYAFDHFRRRHPTDISYALGYHIACAKNGLYSDSDHNECLAGIEAALQLKDSGGAHVKLRRLKLDIERQRVELLADCGPDPTVDTTTPWFQFRAGNYRPIRERFEELAGSITPRGSLGPPEEKEYWDLYQFMIRIAVSEDQINRAIQLMNNFESARIAVKLRTLPDNDLQEAILGYLAQHDPDQAKARLRYWIDTTRIRTVSEMVSAHPLFAEMCDGLEWNTS